jgi:pimeloyl-ACP methyl ester carboxylesterase
MKGFSREFRVIAYSRRFHPPNAQEEGALYTCYEQADDLAGVIRSLGYSSARVVACSWGAYGALACATRYPGLISQLVLGEPPLLWLLRRSEKGKEMHRAYFLNVLVPAYRAFVNQNREEGVRLFFDGIAGGKGEFDKLHVFVQKKLFEAGFELSREFLTPFKEYMPVISDEAIQSIRIPVLLLSGADSPSFFHQITRELHLLIPHAEHEIIAGANHVMQVGNPSAYNEAVKRFLLSAGMTA